MKIVEQVAEFTDIGKAWAFMRRVDAAGGVAGYPSLGGPVRTVRYYLPAGVSL